MVLALRFGAVSDIGRSRRKNDDSGYAGANLLAVADGMGGAPAGDLASSITISTIRRLDAPPPADLLEALAGAIARANDRIGEVIDDDASVDGMGTTLTAVLFDGRQIGVAHIGDSRGYLFRDGRLVPISHDHSWVQSLIDEGRLTEEEAAVHAHRSLLLKVLDGRHDNSPDLETWEVQPGDRVLLCSDGLTGFVPLDRIARIMRVGRPQAVAAELTKLALDAGSTDNVTVVVAEFIEEDPDATIHPLQPLVVGAAADQPRRALARLRTWAHRDEPQSDEMLLLNPPQDPEELRYAPREPGRFLWLKRGLVAALVVAVLVVAGWLGYRWTQQQYYVAADGSHVAIYQGIETDLPGLRMHHVYEQQSLLLSELPTFRRSQVLAGLPAQSLGDARTIVSQLRSFAQACLHPVVPPTTAPVTTLRPRGPAPPSPRTSAGSGGKATRPTATAATPTATSSAPQPGTSSSSGGASSYSPEECAGVTPPPGTAR
ncbi:MAG TPA: protein phosphatase 2C domain-containing protein [Nocardioidaceae bacterium]|nr:protein phosphatase 2C domain-containing protein [Nocardioidaceae bacterium]